MHPSAHRNAALIAFFMLLVAMIPACGDDVTPAQPDDRQYGSVLNAEEFANKPVALPVAALQDPPGPVQPQPSAMLHNLPAIAMQGTSAHLGAPGTCEAQSFGYGLATYTAARNPDGSMRWDASQPGNEVSAAYQFALAVNNGFASCPHGGLATPYLSRLASFGSPSAADVKYEPNCAYFASIDLTRPYPDASRLRIGSFATISIPKHPAPTGVLTFIQEYLAAGHAVAFSGPVYENYGTTVDGPALIDGYFYGAAGASGGHGQLLVGYDNNRGANGQVPGMLLVQNSFGTDWPRPESKAPRGMLYWSYEAFLRNQQFLAVAYPYDPSPPTGTMLTANDPAAPGAAIKRAYQFAPDGDAGDVWLILMHHIAQPIRITAVALTEPSPGIGTATGNYQQFISSGYTYLRRTDGKAFLPGTYQVKYQAQLLDGSAVTYSGTVAVATPKPTNPPAATMVAPTPPPGQQPKIFVYDSLGQAAIVTP